MSIMLVMEADIQNLPKNELLRDVTLVFLIRKTEDRISEICLAMKKKGFGAGWWNGAGGKVEPGESISDAARREAKEEILVVPTDLERVAELEFYFPHHPSWDQRGHVFFSESWEGEVGESEEMKPQWFKVEDIPYTAMWSADRHWIPLILSGKRIRGTFVFDENNGIAQKEVHVEEVL